MDVAGTLVKEALKELVKRWPTPQRALDALAAQLLDEVLVDTAQAVQRLEERVGVDFATLRQRVDELDAALLVFRLLDQATRSAGTERRRLMAQAAAGVYDPELSIEMKSRAERALEQIEPSDVLALRGLAEPDSP